MKDDRNSLAQQSMAFILAGGRGSRLKEMTDIRAKPAVYFGGKTRIIDFALSNAMNSGIRKMAIATQYKAHSLIRHCQRGWSFFRAERNEFLDILPASQRVAEQSPRATVPVASTARGLAEPGARAVGLRGSDARIVPNGKVVHKLVHGGKRVAFWRDSNKHIVLVRRRRPDLVLLLLAEADLLAVAEF